MIGADVSQREQVFFHQEVISHRQLHDQEYRAFVKKRLACELLKAIYCTVGEGAATITLEETKQRELKIPGVGTQHDLILSRWAKVTY